MGTTGDKREAAPNGARVQVSRCEWQSSRGLTGDGDGGMSGPGASRDHPSTITRWQIGSGFFGYSDVDEHQSTSNGIRSGTRTCS